MITTSQDWLSIIRRELERRGMSQRDLAERCKVHEATVSYWFVGRSRLKAANRKRIARALGMRVEDIWGVK